jgi:hypothetical protein
MMQKNSKKSAKIGKILAKNLVCFTPKKVRNFGTKQVQKLPKTRGQKWQILRAKSV